MRVFLTGGAGYLGSAIAKALIEAGHAVTILTRRPERERFVAQLGATPLVANLKEPETYEGLAALHDVIVHTAFDFSGKWPATDRIALETLISAARREGRGLVYTSATWVLGDSRGETAYEDTPLRVPVKILGWRPEHERVVLASADNGVAASVVRPGMIYGGGGGLVAYCFETAAREGAASFVGDGQNYVSLVYREDLARLYRKVVEARAVGIFHGVDDHPLRLSEIAFAASRAAGRDGKTRAIMLDEARQLLGPLADALALDQLVGTKRSKALGWTPRVHSFLEGVDTAFAEWEDVQTSLRRYSDGPPHRSQDETGPPTGDAA